MHNICGWNGMMSVICFRIIQGCLGGGRPEMQMKQEWLRVDNYWSWAIGIWRFIRVSFVHSHMFEIFHNRDSFKKNLLIIWICKEKASIFLSLAKTQLKHAVKFSSKYCFSCIILVFICHVFVVSLNIFSFSI